MSDHFVKQDDVIMRRTEVRRSSAVNVQQCSNLTADVSRMQRPSTGGYELSEDLKKKEIEFLEKQYGDPLKVNTAARIIQSVYRQYKLHKTYDRLKRVSKRFELQELNSKTSEDLSKVDLKRQNSYEDLVINKAYMDWDPDFNNLSSGILNRNNNLNKSPTCNTSNIDSGVESRGTSSVSLTPSPTATTTSTFPCSQTMSNLCIEPVNSSSILSSDNVLSSKSTLPSSQSTLVICDNVNSTSNEQEISALPAAMLSISPNTTSASISQSTLLPTADLNSSFYNNNYSHQFDNHNSTNAIPFILPGCNTRLVGLQFPSSCFCQNTRRNKRLYRICLNIFNKNSVKGVVNLITYGFVENNPVALSKFLMTRKGLSRISIGDYLGQIHDELSKETLRYVTRLVNMREKEVDIALRSLLSYFQIPGESQKVAHILEKFTDAYIEQNQDNWANRFNDNRDAVMLLSYAIIMLHTDTYSPSIRKSQKMTKQAFIHNLRDDNNLPLIDREILGGIYDRIKSVEIRTNPDHTNQVRKISQHFIGDLTPTSLVEPHRRLVCYCRMTQIKDVKRDRPGSHLRDVFLFNDVVIVTKCEHKRRKERYMYRVRNVLWLSDIKLYLFETQNLPHGLVLSRLTSSPTKETSDSPHHQDDDQLILHTDTSHDRKRFIDDVTETINELLDMDRLRLQQELCKQSRGDCYHSNTELQSPPASGNQLRHYHHQWCHNQGVPAATYLPDSRECQFPQQHNRGVVNYMPPAMQERGIVVSGAGVRGPYPGAVVHHQSGPHTRYFYPQTINTNSNTSGAGANPRSSSITRHHYHHNPSQHHQPPHGSIAGSLVFNTKSTGAPTTGATAHHVTGSSTSHVYDCQYRISGDSGLQEDIE